jgi:2-isopropylmalate synthase
MTDPVSEPAPAVPASEQVIIFDTTMRDGEQSPGASMSHDEKLEWPRYSRT